MNPLKIAIHRIDNTLPIPSYKTAGAVAFDLYVREEVTVAPHSIGFIPNNIIMEIPDGYGLFILSRSSTPKRLMISQPHGFGLIDRDYCGPEDELKTLVYNLSDTPVTIERGDRISQGIIVPLPVVEFHEQPLQSTTTRGGFGSTSTGDLSR